MLFLRPKLGIQRELVSCHADPFHRWSREAWVNVARQPLQSPDCAGVSGVCGVTVLGSVLMGIWSLRKAEASISPLSFVEGGLACS